MDLDQERGFVSKKKFKAKQLWLFGSCRGDLPDLGV
jgi:hypothetical protein